MWSQKKAVKMMKYNNKYGYCTPGTLQQTGGRTTPCTYRAVRRPRRHQHGPCNVMSISYAAFAKVPVSSHVRSWIHELVHGSMNYLSLSSASSVEALVMVLFTQAWSEAVLWPIRWAFYHSFMAIGTTGGRFPRVQPPFCTPKSTKKSLFGLRRRVS